MLRSLKFKVQRSVFEIIYFAFVSPILEYGSIVWGSVPRHEKYFSEMDKLQIHAARIELDVIIMHQSFYRIETVGWTLEGTGGKNSDFCFFTKSLID